jgi:hypothetical protein
LPSQLLTLPFSFLYQQTMMRPMDFDEFDYDDHNDEDARRHSQKEKERIDQLPIMLKAREIFEITYALIGVINEEEDVLLLRDRMLEASCVLGPKIAGAEAGDFYTLRMENAVLIKLNARDLQAQNSLLISENLVDPSYTSLLRKTIQEFRELFIEWVSGFDKSNDIEDGWGTLFR